MTRLLQNLTIKGKLLSIQLYSSISGLFLAALVLLVFEVIEFKQTTQEDLTAMAELIANRSTAALMFDDPDLAKENLAALSQLPVFHSACLYDQAGQVFTAVQQSVHHLKEACPKQYKGESSYYNGTWLYVYHTINLDGDNLGTVYIHIDLEQVFIRKLQYLAVLFSVLFIVTVITFLLTTPLLKVIVEPLKKLLLTVNAITKENDYSRRAIKYNDDEIGELVNSFNGMLATVEFQNRAILTSKDHYQALYDDNPTMIFNLSIDGKVNSVNQFGAKQLGLATAVLQNKSIFDFIHPDDEEAEKRLFDYCFAEPKKVHKYELRLLCYDKRIIWVRETARVVINENRLGSILLVCEDITENRVLSEKIAFQASHDALTGLVNRSEFDVVLQQVVNEIDNDKVE